MVVRTSKRSASRRKAVKAGKSELPLADVLERAAYLRDVELDHRAACATLREALTRAPHSTTLLLALCDLLTTSCDNVVRNEAGARKLLKNSIKLAPEGGIERYFLLGQLLSDQGRENDALKAYRAGLALVETGGGVEDAAVVAQAWVSVGELYMTTALADNEDAEDQVTAAIAHGMRLARHSLDVINLAATYHNVKGNAALVQQYCREGCEFLHSVLSSSEARRPLFARDAAAETAKVADNTSSEMTDCSEQLESPRVLPSLGTRVAFASTLVNAGMYAEAIDCIERTLDEDRHNPCAWHILATACTLGKDDTRAEEAVEELRALLEDSAGCATQDQLAYWDSALAELTKLQKETNSTKTNDTNDSKTKSRMRESKEMG